MNQIKGSKVNQINIKMKKEKEIDPIAIKK